MNTMDEIAYSSPFRDWSPLGKLALTLSLLVSSLIASSILIPLIVFLVGFALFFHSTRLRLPRVIAFALLNALLIFIVSALVIALVTAGQPLWAVDLWVVTLHFSQEGVQLATLVFFRAVAGVMVMLFFAASTPLPQLANALRQVKVPKEIVELTVLVYRYSFLLLEQLSTMYVAADCRLGFRGYRNKYRTTSKLAVNVFTRSMDMAERSQVALNARGFRGVFHSYRSPVRLSIKWIVLSAAVFFSLYAINQLVIEPGHVLGMFKM